MARSTTSWRWTLLRVVAFGAACIAAGVLVGSWWPAGDAEVVWRGGSVLDGGANASSSAHGPPVTFADIVDAARPGVVTVRAHVSAETGYRNGSGFVVNEAGLVVTSRHIVADVERLEVIVPGRGQYAAVVVGEDKATDLAILRLDNAPELPALPLGSSERLRAGDWIVAVGNPYGFAQTVTAGVVSFVGRHLPHSDLAVTSDFLQISAPVNPGSSGCPVLDLEGRVVGVTTQAAVEAQGISFAVPSQTLKWSLEEMARSENGVVRRGYLGIEFRTRTEVDEHGQPLGGAEIVRVVEGAPADRAGIRRGDVILEVDGVAVADATVLHQRIVRGRPGGHIALQVLRQGRVQDPIQAVLSEMGRKVPVQVN